MMAADCTSPRNVWFFDSSSKEQLRGVRQNGSITNKVFYKMLSYRCFACCQANKHGNTLQNYPSPQTHWAPSPKQTRRGDETYMAEAKAPSFRIYSFCFMDLTSSLSEPWPPGYISLHSLFLSLHLMDSSSTFVWALASAIQVSIPEVSDIPPPRRVHSRLTSLAGYAPFPFCFFSSSHLKAIVSLLYIHYCWRVVQIFSSENHTRKLSSQE